MAAAEPDPVEYLRRWTGFGGTWHSSDANFPPYALPRILTGGGPTYLGVISGSPHYGPFHEDECAPGMRMTHTDLNKDSPRMTVQFHGFGPEDHYTAAELATRQTAHEWCRILHLEQRGLSLGHGDVAHPHQHPLGGNVLHGPRQVGPRQRLRVAPDVGIR